MRRLGAIIAAAVLAAGWGAAAQSARQPQEANGYTRYELLAPGSGKFRIIYDITAVRPGATAFFNPIRKGSIASDESVPPRHRPATEVRRSQETTAPRDYRLPERAPINVRKATA